MVSRELRVNGSTAQMNDPHLTATTTASRPKLRFAPRGLGYHAELKRRVDEYFEKNGISKRGNAAMVAKTIFWFGFTALVYSLLLFGGFGAWVSLLLAGLLGFCLACIGFNIGHDAIHGAYSNKPWVNDLLGWSFQLLGASAYTWSISHNIVHHTYTNVVGHDGDIEPGPLLRFHTGHPVRSAYRFQHLYAWFLYCFVGLIWVFTKDFEQILRPDPRTGKRAGVREWLSVLAAKALHIAIFIVAPLVVLWDSFALWQLAVGYLAMQFVGGFTLSVVFQLAHVVEGVGMPSSGQDGSMHDSWAEHQMRTTANFAPRGFLATFICGGLNHQIEHHLFPKICHIHYPAISRIVAETAQDFGLPYVEHPTFLKAVTSHARVLKHLGTAPQREPLTLDPGVLPSAA